MTVDIIKKNINQKYFGEIVVIIVNAAQSNFRVSALKKKKEKDKKKKRTLACVQFDKDHNDCNLGMWSKLIWTDESKFSITLEYR